MPLAFRRRRLRLLLGRSVLPLALCWGAAAGAAAPALAEEPIATRIEVFGFAGVHVLTMRSRTNENGDRYALSLDYATEGLAKVFVDLTTRAKVSGRIIDGVADPEQFRNDSVRNGRARHSRVDYRPDGTVDAAVTPAAAGPIPPARARGTVDNLTAYFRLERQLTHTGNCAMTVRVFDGRHAYDLVFSNAGRQMIGPRAGQNFAGPTIVCHMVRRDWLGVADPEADEGARSGTIWYARLIPGDLLIPVRTQMDTQLGVVDGLLAELHATEVNLSLMP